MKSDHQVIPYYEKKDNYSNRKCPVIDDVQIPDEAILGFFLISQDMLIQSSVGQDKNSNVCACYRKAFSCTC